MQAHPEFCTRPLNPSPPYLGFVAAACGENVLREQIERQKMIYTPPHPAARLVLSPSTIEFVNQSTHPSTLDEDLLTKAVSNLLPPS